MRVVVNAAVSVDGRLALAGGKRLALSGREDLQRVHGLRASSDAILVGVGTVLADDPSLLVTEEHLGRAPATQPLRVVLDSRGRTPPTARVVDARAKTLILTTPGVKTEWSNAEVAVAGDAGGRVDPAEALRELASRGITTVLVEGGGHVIHSFLRAGVVAEVFLYHAPVVVGGGAPSLAEGEGAATADALTRLVLADAHRLGEGLVTHWRPAGAPTA